MPFAEVPLSCAPYGSDGGDTPGNTEGHPPICLQVRYNLEAYIGKGLPSGELSDAKIDTNAWSQNAQEMH